MAYCKGSPSDSLSRWCSSSLLRKFPSTFYHFIQVSPSSYFINNLMFMHKKFTHCSQLTAAINVYSTCIVCILLILVLFYARRKYQRGNQRTNFYFYWFSWSVAYLLVLFQTNVPIMEVLPEENLLFIVLLTLMLICFYMVSPLEQLFEIFLLSICIILGSSS